MYISIREDILYQAGYLSIAEGLKDLGLDSVEVEFFRDYAVYAASSWQKMFLDRNNLAETIKKFYGPASIRICAFLLHNNFNCADRSGEVNWVIDVVRTAETLKIPVIRIDAVTEGELEEPFEYRVNRFVSCIKEVLSATEGSPVQLGIENHGLQGNDPNFLHRIIKQVDNIRLGINMDTGNFYWYGFPLNEVYEILSSVSKYTKHTHVKNIRYPEKNRNRRREVGWDYEKYVSPVYDGDIDHGRVVQILKSAGYEGPLTIEDESLGKFAKPEEKKEVLKKDTIYLKTLLA